MLQDVIQTTQLENKIRISFTKPQIDVGSIRMAQFSIGLFKHNDNVATDIGML